MEAATPDDVTSGECVEDAMNNLDISSKTDPGAQISGQPNAIQTLTKVECIAKLKGYLREFDDVQNFDLTDEKHGTMFSFIRKLTFHSFHQNSPEIIVQFIEPLLGSGIVSIYARYMSTVLQGRNLDDGGQLVKIFSIVHVIMWNCSDKSTEFCEKITACSCPQAFLQILSRDCMTDAKFRESKTHLQIAKGALGISHNILQRIPPSRALYREYNGVNVVSKLQNSAIVSLKFKALIILSFIVDESENNLLYSTPANITFILKVLKDCLIGESHHYSKRYGYHLGELLNVLSNISSEDRNKVQLIDAGLLMCMEESLTIEGGLTEIEETNILTVLWNLSFHEDCKHRMKDSPRLMQFAVEASNTLTNKTNRMSACGVLWNMKGYYASPDQSSVVANCESTVLEGGVDKLSLSEKKKKKAAPPRSSTTERAEHTGARAISPKALPRGTSQPPPPPPPLPMPSNTSAPAPPPPCPSASSTDSSKRLGASTTMGGLDAPGASSTHTHRRRAETTEERERQSTKPNLSAHIMMSYQHSYQPRIVDITSKLRTEDLNVWLDVDDMAGSTLEAMAHAVEQASIVVIGLCQAYKNSPNCRAEAEYAFRLNKPIIPLRLEPRYKADGWLGMIIGTKLFFDVSDDARYAKNINNFIREVKLSGCVDSNGVDSTDALAPSHAENIVPSTLNNVVRSSPPLNMAHSDDMANWSEVDVQRWLTEHVLMSDEARIVLSGLDGPLLLEMRCMLTEAPTSFHQWLQTLNIDFLNSLRFSKAVREIRK